MTAPPEGPTNLVNDANGSPAWKDRGPGATLDAQWRTVLLFALIGLVSAAAFVLLGTAVAHDADVVLVDRAVAVWAAAHRSMVEAQAGLLLAGATGPVVLAGAAVLTSIMLWLRGRRFDSWLLGGAVVAAFGIGGLVKHVDHRDRPLAPVNLTPESEGSFPSGHVLVLATLMGVVLVLGWPRLTRRTRWAATSAALGLMLLVSLDRLVVGAHWLSDVVASLTLAVAIAAAAGAVQSAIRPQRVEEGTSSGP